ncbi:hypothetical protein MBLNU457_2029t1 [Dothideomycetes sp. NU457]
MPEEGVPLSPKDHILTTPEIFYLSSLFVSQGVTKIRLTGGEPTVRHDIVPLMQQIGSLRSRGLRELALTTNGISLHRKLDDMVEAGLTGVNISLDTLDPFQFQIMTRRKGFDAVWKSIDRILEMNKLGSGIKLKINCVVMRGMNEREILPFVELGREKDIEVRFIEYMPFGGNKWSERKMVSYSEMIDIIREKYPGLQRLQGHKNDTSKTYQVPGFVGRVGFITSMTSEFCGSCNRLRITSDGNLKVCLHGNTEVSLRDMLRKDNNGIPIDQETFEAMKELEMNRHQGLLSDSVKPSWTEREMELLNIVGMAVKRKKEKHAGIGELENMENRPMILIDDGKKKQAKPIDSYLRSSNSIFGASTRPTLSRPNIPLHMLHAGDVGLSSIRAFSTRGAAGAPEGANIAENTSSASRTGNLQAEILTSELGFQSLTPVFQAPRGRYSSRLKPAEALASPPSEDTSTSQPVESVQSRQASTKRDRTRTRTSRRDPASLADSRQSTRTTTEKSSSGAFRRLSLPPSEPKVPFPWTKRNSQRPQTTAEEFADTADEIPAPRSSEPISARTSAAQLTHVDSAGEAHMVDVGHKDSTTRLAIASGYVRFSNAEALRLIVENSNKKGDVISTARIAGIMAAKRCSDLIPLCHPIAISKVSVKVRVHQPDDSSPLLDRTEYGAVSIEAGVRCYGPTGVEMEALTAVMGACLTVYDMCKAVDKSMTIESGKLLFKEGGRSGTYIDETFRGEYERRLEHKEKLV